ncbi:MAG: hypothetical protein ABIK66_05920, partial [candidate division WOR-3 bacterium]
YRLTNEDFEFPDLLGAAYEYLLKQFADKEYNLLQAIARVNRVYKNKSCGFVIDYVGVLKHLKEALSIYADKDIEEIMEVVKDKAKSIDELRKFNRAMDAVLPGPEALKYVTDLKILNFIKESARQRYRDEKLSIKEASRKIREIVEEYLISKGIDPKIPPIPLLDEGFLKKLKREIVKVRKILDLNQRKRCLFGDF